MRGPVVAPVRSRSTHQVTRHRQGGARWQPISSASSTAEGRDELVTEVRRRIDAEGITYIYYQFISVTGRIMGKGVPAAHWESDGATRASSSSTARPRTSSPTATATTSATAPRRAELVGIPEPETFQPLPWDPKVARVWCTLLPQPRGARGPRRLPHLGLPRQPEAHPGRVRGRRPGSTSAPAPSPR